MTEIEYVQGPEHWQDFDDNFPPIEFATDDDLMEEEVQ